MSIVTFYNNNIEQTGKTMSITAIATFMSIEHNYRILIISTTNKEDNLKNCFWEEKKKRRNLGIFGPNANLEVQNGVEGLTRIIRSNKITPDIITNYTKVVFKDRLEVLLGSNQVERNSPELQNIEKTYPEIIKSANKYYDLVFVDLDENVDEETKTSILDMSDVTVVNLSQRLRSINKFAETKVNTNRLKDRKKLILIGRYDKYSKYNSKNITRYLGEKNQVLTVPYNTLFMEASEEAGVPDLFLRFRKMAETEDVNGFFISEIRRASENIIYRLQDLQMKL
ncbi:MAG: hypothetical protein ACLTPN_01685 [Clostridia bacterium]